MYCQNIKAIEAFSFAFGSVIARRWLAPRFPFETQSPLRSLVSEKNTRSLHSCQRLKHNIELYNSDAWKNDFACTIFSLNSISYRVKKSYRQNRCIEIASLHITYFYVKWHLEKRKTGWRENLPVVLFLGNGVSYRTKLTIMRNIELEIELRGEIAFWSALLESIMVRLILISQPKTRRDEYVNLKDLDFSSKIDKTFSYLKRYYRPIFKAEFRGLQQSVHDLRKFRNRMIHCGFTWDSVNPNKVNVWDVFTESDGMDYMDAVPYRVSSIRAETKKLKEFTIKFIHASALIDLQVKAEFPFLFRGMR